MSARATRTMQRNFVTPEGVDLELTLASAGERAGGFIVDALIMIAILIGVTVFIVLVLGGFAQVNGSVLEIIWLIGFFVLRNFYFVLYEMGSRGATPGKRVQGTRVVARDGARLTGAAVITRNAMREIEVFLPLTLYGAAQATDMYDSSTAWLALLWATIFLFFPLFNRDRLRAGDMLAGTWVVEVVRQTLAPDLAEAGRSRPRWTFSDEALELYGEYELQTLERVLRRGDEAAMAIVANTIRAKMGSTEVGHDHEFLHDYHTALCARLERGLMVGQRRADKFDGA